MFNKNFALLFLLCMCLAGCTGFSPFIPGTTENEQSQADVEVVLPMPGEEVFIKDTATGIESAVRIENVYQAASGRTCSYYSRSAGSTRPDGFTCLVNDQWTQLPMIINPDRPENLQ